MILFLQSTLAMYKKIDDKTILLKHLIFFVPLIFANTVLAHHSVNYHFNPDAPNAIEGVVKEFIFRNPHTEMYVDVTDSGGTITTWRVEMTSRATLQKQGWTAEQFKPGQAIKIDGFLARRDANTMYLRNADVGDGNTTSFKYGRLAGSLDSNPDDYNVDTAEKVDAAKINTSVLGNWVRAVKPENLAERGQPLGPDEINPYLANLTQIGLDAANKYVAEVDDPALQCQVPSITRVWAQPDFSPTNISQDGDVITIQHEVFDFKRTVYLNQPHPETIEPSLKGHSIATYEGDTLVIETIGFKGGILVTHPGIFHSDQMKIIERLSVDKETGRLKLEWTATDPIYFAKPQLGGFYYARSDIAIGEFNCELE